VSSIRRARKELAISLTLFTDEPCPKCRKPIRQTTIDLHPSIPNIALHNYECADCGPVKTEVISLAPKKPPAEMAA
jgi:C4-type Zn-finger protein